MSDPELQMTTSYPDITPLLAAKQRRRQELAALSWEEKVAIIEKMRRLLPRHQWRRPDALPATTSNPDQAQEPASSSTTP
jgi:hypothetical protein